MYSETQKENDRIRQKLSKVLYHVAIQQKAISTKLGIHQSLLSKFKIGERDLGQEELDMLEDFLNKVMQVFDIKEV